MYFNINIANSYDLISNIITHHDIQYSNSWMDIWKVQPESMTLLLFSFVVYCNTHYNRFITFFFSNNCSFTLFLVFLNFFCGQSFLKCVFLWHKKHFKFLGLSLIFYFFFFFLSNLTFVVKPSPNPFPRFSYFPYSSFMLTTDLTSSRDNVCLSYIEVSTKYL